MGTSFQNVKAAHDVNGQIMNPVPVDFNLPLTISNPEDPEQQTPIALHVIVDNASDFPSGGSSGGGVAFLTIPAEFMADIVDDQTSLVSFTLLPIDGDYPYAAIQINPELESGSNYVIPVPANTPFVISMVAEPGVSFTMSDDVYIYQLDDHQEIVAFFEFITELIFGKDTALWPDDVDPIVFDSNHNYVITLGEPSAPK